MKKIKLLLLNDWLYGGGAERSMSILANELVKIGKYDISLLILEDKISYSLDSRIKIYSFREKYKFGSISKLITLPLDVIRLIHLIKKYKFDTVLSFQHRSNLINCLSKIFFSNYKSIISERVYTIDFFKNRGLNSIFYNYMIKKFYDFSDLITCNANDIKFGLIKFYNCKKEKIYVIENAYDVGFIKNISNEELEDNLFESFLDKKVIINVGRLEKQKGHEYLIRAFSMIPNKNDYRVVIIGEGPLKKNLEDLLLELKLNKYIYLLGHKKNPYKYLKKSDIFVFPSLYEGYPNALAEASIFEKLNIVSFDFKSGARDILGDSEFGTLVRLKDIKGLSDAILDNKKYDNSKQLNTIENLVDSYSDLI